jgi:hypothetical protein
VHVDTRSSSICTAQEASIRKTNEREPATFVDGQQDQLANALAPHAERSLWHNPQAETDEMVDPSAIARDGGLDDRVEAVVSDG